MTTIFLVKVFFVKRLKSSLCPDILNMYLSDVLVNNLDLMVEQAVWSASAPNTELNILSARY